MLTPEYLQNLSDEITSLYDSLNEFTINDIARRIAKTNDITDSAAWQINMLQNAGMHRDAVEKEVARLLNETEAKVYQMFEDAGVTTLEYDDVIYRKAGKNPVPLYLNKRLMTILTVEASKTFGTFKNLVSTTAEQSEKLFIDTCSAAYLQVSSGILDYNTAIRNAVNTISKRSATVKYPSGHVDKVDVAARRCILTSVNQTAAKVQIEHAFEMECDLMEISAHSGARPDHASWQGKIVSLSGRSGYLSLLDIGYGEVTGFMGANCRHSWSPYFEGISKPVYTNAQLEEFKNETVTYNDEVIPKWKAIEKQRYYERSIRETRRSLSALDGAIKGTADKEALKKLEQDFTSFSIKLKNQEARLKDLCKQTGLLIDNSRVQAYGFGKSVSQKAVERFKTNTLTNAAGKTIIKVEKTTLRGFPNTITQKVNAKGGIDRNYYGSDGKQTKQISNNDHNNKAESNYGVHGEHAHDYKYDENGNLISRHSRPLTPEERKENSDIL
ncbi:MAG: phage capsid protein [Ruminococcaceae bacterium]|nr:phage capsid protein [Oscillospiraceae bacterium]